MDIDVLRKRALQITERMDGARLHQELIHAADLIISDKHAEAEAQLYHILSVRANLFTVREIERTHDLWDIEDEQFEAESMVLREAEAEVINAQINRIMANAAAIVTGNKRYGRTAIALWLMITIADLPLTLEGHFQRAFLDYDDSKTGT